VQNQLLVKLYRNSYGATFIENCNMSFEIKLKYRMIVVLESSSNLIATTLFIYNYNNFYLFYFTFLCLYTCLLWCYCWPYLVHVVTIVSISSSLSQCLILPLFCLVLFMSSCGYAFSFAIFGSLIASMFSFSSFVFLIFQI